MLCLWMLRQRMAHIIIPATPDLMIEIETWLDEEEHAYNSGDLEVRGFRCNWCSTKSRWAEGSDQVDVLVVDGKAIGFLSNMDILEIHPDHRRKGFGKLLADHMLARAFDDGYSMVEIEIAPESAESFWVDQMGFKPDHEDIRHRNGLYATKFLARTFPLGDGPRVSVEIAFYDEKSRYNQGMPVTTWAGDGERHQNGEIQLPHRVHGYDPTLWNNIENHIQIVVDGKELFFDRAKYGLAHGAAKDPGGSFYIDRIRP